MVADLTVIAKYYIAIASLDCACGLSWLRFAVEAVLVSPGISIVTTHASAARAAHDVEPAYAWRRLWISLALGTLGGSAVVLGRGAARGQAEFGVTRGEASLAYTLTMIGFATGGIPMGRLPIASASCARC